MFKPKGLHKIKTQNFQQPSQLDAPNPDRSLTDQEDGSSMGEHMGMRGGAGAPRRPRGLAGLRPK